MNTCVSRVAVKARPRPFERHAHGGLDGTSRVEHQPGVVKFVGKQGLRVEEQQDVSGDDGRQASDKPPHPEPGPSIRHGWQSFTHQPYEWPQATSPTRAQPSP